MQIGFFELPAGWQELETATGGTFASGQLIKYNRGRVCDKLFRRNSLC